MKAIVFRQLVCGLSIALLAAGCGEDGSPLPAVVDESIVHMNSFLLDADGKTPSDEATPVYEARTRTPVVHPDGRPVTLNQFDAVTGSATASCTGSGTQVELHLRGLIPNGVYTIANETFSAPVSGSMLSDMVGQGTVGSRDGDESTLRASSTGEGELLATTPSGELSMLGSIGPCALESEFAWRIVGVYHINGQTYGSKLGPEGTYVEQFAFMFEKSPATTQPLPGAPCQVGRVCHNP